jgi:hypothetical protein
MERRLLNADSDNQAKLLVEVPIHRFLGGYCFQMLQIEPRLIHAHSPQEQFGSESAFPVSWDSLIHRLGAGVLSNRISATTNLNRTNIQVVSGSRPTNGLVRSLDRSCEMTSREVSCIIYSTVRLLEQLWKSTKYRSIPSDFPDSEHPPVFNDVSCRRCYA